MVVLPPTVDDLCVCGHLRGEHLLAVQEGDPTRRCLMIGCKCPVFKLVSVDGQGGPVSGKAPE